MTGAQTNRIRNEQTAPPLVPPRVAGIGSLIVPGLGQILARQYGRGALLFASFVTIWGMLWLRVQELGRLAATPGWAQFTRALQRRPGFVGLVLAALILLWLVGAWDAYRCARDRRKPFTGLFVWVLFGFFVLGWQISEIDLVKLVREAPNALPPLSRILWPWEAAFQYDTERLSAHAQILVNEGPTPEVQSPQEGVPYVSVEPNVGRLSMLDAQNRPVPGTQIAVHGYNFEPNTRLEIWWRDSLGNEFRPRSGGQYILLQTDEDGAFEFEMTMPYQLIPPSFEGPVYHRLEARQEFQVGFAKPSEPLRLTVNRMIETIFMGMMATLFGIVFSIPVSFFAARNIMNGSIFTMAIYYLTRTVLNIIRSIEPLIWALIAVVWVGLGPFAGIVALTLHSVAALGKLYSEAIESIDPGPIEAIQATGANRLQTIMFAVIPQMVSPFISFSIYRWDINVRMSTVIGLVGGGGIGFLLVQYIRLLDYRSAGIAVWFIAVTVAILDYVSAEIRNRML